MFEKKPLRRTFGPERKAVTGGRKKSQSEELHELYSALHIRGVVKSRVVRVIKSRRMRWAGHVARMGEDRGCIGSWWGNRRERDHWGDLGVDG